jgi:hypothetical protein
VCTINYYRQTIESIVSLRLDEDVVLATFQLSYRQHLSQSFKVTKDKWPSSTLRGGFSNCSARYNNSLPSLGLKSRDGQDYLNRVLLVVCRKLTGSQSNASFDVGPTSRLRTIS